jgi:hypothetical protein
MVYQRKVAMVSQDLGGNLKWDRSQLVLISLSLFPQNLVLFSSLLYLGRELPRLTLM